MLGSLRHRRVIANRDKWTEVVQGCGRMTSKPEVVKPAVHVSAKNSQFSWICEKVALAHRRTAAQFLFSTHATPIPRLCPCSSSEGGRPSWLTGSTFGSANSSSTSVALRCEL